EDGDEQLLQDVALADNDVGEFGEEAMVELVEIVDLFVDVLNHDFLFRKAPSKPLLVVLMAQRISNDIDHQPQGVVAGYAFGVGVGFAVDAAHEVEGGIDQGQAAVEEETIELGKLQRGIIFQGTGSEGDPLDRVPAANEERVRGRQLDQVAVGKRFL